MTEASESAKGRAGVGRTSDTTPLPYPSPRRVWTAATLATWAFNTIVAVVLTVFAITPGGFVANLTYSYSIGFLIMIGILLPRTLIWYRRPPHPIAFGGIAVVATIFGMLGGRAIAGWYLGHAPTWSVSVEATTFAVSLGISVFAAFAATTYFWTREREAVFALHTAQARERAETMARQLTETQLQLLRAQVDPHMLFNTLANLRALIPQDPAAAQRLLDHLIDFFRASLDASRIEWSSIDRDFKLAADYLALLEIRLGSRLRYTIELPQALERVRIPSMLVQPLVENAVKHGIEPAIRGGEVRLSAARIDGLIELTVTDTGVGLTAASVSSAASAGTGTMPSADEHRADDGRRAGGAGSHFGNAQLRARLATLYGDRARFELQPNRPAGAIARVRLPDEPAA